MITDASFIELYGNMVVALTTTETEWREDKNVSNGTGCCKVVRHNDIARG
jgi:hypothetical protein